VTVPTNRRPAQDDLYADAAMAYGGALERLAQAYEPDPDRRRDLLQEIHVALWKSFGGYDGRCSGRTWVYRVAHNVAISEVTRRRARTPPLVGIDALESVADGFDHEEAFDRQRARERLLGLVRRLQPLDRQVIVLYLEGLDAAAIAEVTGFSPPNVATKIHRLKKLLAQRFHERAV